MQLLEDVNLIKLSIDEGTGKILIKGPFGLCGTPTANKRLYSREIIESNIQSLTEAMKNRRLFGELDHPCLTSDDFRVLTEDGWKEFSSISVGDKVWSRVDGVAVLSDVTGIVDEPYSGPAYKVIGRAIESTFTPGHRILHQKRPGRYAPSEQYVTAKELFEDEGKYTYCAIPRTAIWKTDGMSFVPIPGVPGINARGRRDPKESLLIPEDVFAGFMGIYLSEGSCSSEKVESYRVSIWQKNEWSRGFIRDELLSKFPEEIVWSEDPNGLHTHDARLYTYLKSLGNVYEKRIPREVMGLSVPAMKELLFWFTIGDGRYVGPDRLKSDDSKTLKEQDVGDLRSGGAKYTRQDVFCVSEPLIRGLHELLVMSGGAGSLSVIHPEHDYEFAGHVIKAENKAPLYQLHFSRSENIWLDKRFMSVDEVHHDGNIYCLSVTNGNFYMEQNGKSFWTGNSDGKTSLKRVSHIVTDLKIESDGTVTGVAEPLSTPMGNVLLALAKAGCELGVSSRGMGSTITTDGGIDEVQGDFVLKTYDFVADPASKNAYPKVVSEAFEEALAVYESEEELFENLGSEARDGALEEAKIIVRKEIGDSHSSVVSAKDEEISSLSGQVDRLKQSLAGSLVEHLENIREDIRAEERAKLMADPEVAGAKAMLEAIAGVIQPMMVPGRARGVISDLKNDKVALQDALNSTNFDLANAHMEMASVKSDAQKELFGARLSEMIAGHPKADLIRKVVGPVERFESEDELVQRVEVLFTEIGDTSSFVTAAHGDLESQIADLRMKTSESEGVVADLRSKLAKAVEIGEAFAKEIGKSKSSLRESEAQVYAAREAIGRSDAEKIIRLTESCASVDEVDRVLNANKPQPLNESDESTRIRSRVSRGKEWKLDEGDNTRQVRGKSDSLLNQSMDEIARLSGMDQ